MLKITGGSLLKSLKRIFKQINSVYRVNIINEETMQEALTLHLTKKSVFIVLSSMFISMFLLFSILIFFTPLKYYVPGNNNKEVSRKTLIQLQQLSDSVTKLNSLQEKYIYNLLQITKGNSSFLRDTNLLNQREINQAMIQNTNQIDRASRYDYLKNQKPDTNVDKSVHKKDSL